MPSLMLTPRGHLLFTVEDDALSLSGPPVHRLETAFGRGSGHGLFELGAAGVGTVLPADLTYWRDFSARLVTAICTHPDLTADHSLIPAPALNELEALAAAAPPMTGAEDLDCFGSRNALDRDRDSVSIRARRFEGVGRGVSSPEKCRVASRRPRAFQSCREPAG